jgi:predicted peptidase
VIFLPFVASAAARASPSLENITPFKDTQSLRLQVVQDPDTYQAVEYTPANISRRYPLLLILHGAGRNDSNDAAQSLLYSGEHMGLAPDLFRQNQAPDILAENFIVVAPYVGKGKRSFYSEPRSKLLQFVNWFCTQSSFSTRVDGDAKFLFGFSEGANVAVELATTRKFRAVAIAAYGFSGVLPTRALSCLQNIPFWVFHSADDVIYNVEFSDKLVQSLRSVAMDKRFVRYTRYESDPEGFTGAIQGHSTGISASKNPELYEWMLSFC